jgi:putative tryptophan/tyrosine transport system substrate-binding protein
MTTTRRLAAILAAAPRLAMLHRRGFILLLASSAVAPTASPAQDRRIRVGFLAPETPSASASQVALLRDALRAYGYVETRNLEIEFGWLAGSSERDTKAIFDFAHKVDIIVAWTSPSVVAARRATSTTPIVMVAVGDPLGLGLVASLSRPGGNVTGVTNLSRDLSGKIIQLLTEVAPSVQRIGIVQNPQNPSFPLILRDTEQAIRDLHRDPIIANARVADDFVSAFRAFQSASVGAVVLLADPSVLINAKLIADLAKEARLPTAFQRRESVEAGGLLSYGASLQDQFQRAAFYVDRIAKGEKPANLPVEQPTKFELAINLKTAQALGLTISPSLLARANQVIE